MSSQATPTEATSGALGPHQRRVLESFYDDRLPAGQLMGALRSAARADANAEAAQAAPAAGAQRPVPARGREGGRLPAAAG